MATESEPVGKSGFDLSGLFAAIDAQREDRGLSWSALAREVGVAATTIRRFGNSDDAEADGVLALVRWLGAAPEDFFDAGTVAAEPLLPAGSGYVRVDMELVAQALGDKHGARGRTRTTIQKLVSAAQRARQPLATLTRFSET